MSPPAALIFDMDGVLVDTIDLHFHAWQKVAEAIGVPFTRADMDRIRGQHRRDGLQYLLQGRALADHEMADYFAVKDRALDERLENLSAADVLPGVFSLLEQARAAGVPVGVASSSVQARTVLRQTGLDAWFDVIADGHTVTRLKPAPDIFIWVAGALRARLLDVIVFEDSRSGVEAARAGGMFVVGLGRADLVGTADLVLPGLDHTSLDDLSAALAAARGTPR